jgi:hypothetical protein
MWEMQPHEPPLKSSKFSNNIFAQRSPDEVVEQPQKGVGLLIFVIILEIILG